MTTALVLPSPLLPAVAYAALPVALAGRGWAAVVAEAPPAPDGPEPVLAAYRAAVAQARPDLVVAHSNAGRYAVTVASGAPVVYVDAALPPEEGAAPLAPDELLSHLTAMAGPEGLLPPWTHWWPGDDVAAVVPDEEALAGIRAAEGRLPLSYFRASLAAPSGWTGRPQAYLCYGDTYADELVLARRLGWPVAVIEGAGHLHHLVDPDAVAAAIDALARRLGVGPAWRP